MIIHGLVMTSLNGLVIYLNAISPVIKKTVKYATHIQKYVVKKENAHRNTV